MKNKRIGYESPAVETVEVCTESYCFSISGGDGLGTGSDWPGFGGSGDGTGSGSDWPNFQ